ncbi:MAG: tetratricopeptide repeat protein [Phycisphaeraceae bacterium]|nr:tetratricopeptide repeat protein [Phycisphaeraceae bacterium]
MAAGLSLPIATVVVSGAAQSAGGLGAPALSVGAGLLGFASTVWGDLLANRLQRGMDDADAERDRIFNHDLAKAVAGSIATLLEKIANDESLQERERAALRAVAKGAEGAWLAIVDRSPQGIEPLLEERIANVVVADPENPALGRYGDREMWLGVIRAMAAECGKDAASALGLGDGTQEPSRGATLAIDACHDGFARRFFDDLKHDFATKGQAFAAVHLRMLGEVLSLARNGAGADDRTRRQIDNLNEIVNGLIAGIVEANSERKAELRVITTGLIEIDARLKLLLDSSRTQGETLDRVESKVDRLLSNIPAQLAAILINRSHLSAASTDHAANQLGFTEEEIALARRARESTNAVTRAQALIVLGEHARAREELAKFERNAEEAAEGTAQYYTALGETFYFQERYGEAAERFERAYAMMRTPDRAIMLANALARTTSGNIHATRDRAIALYTEAIELPGAPAEQVARALSNRGVVHGQHGRVEQEIADYTRAIELPGAPAEQVARALYNRGFMHGRQGRVDEAIADYTRAIELPGAPAEQVARALYNRAITHGSQKRVEQEIADYTRAIELPGAPAEQVAGALVGRGVAHGRQGRVEQEIADYTRAIELPGAPAEQVARALSNRGFAHGSQGRVEQEIADYTRAIELPGAPAEQVATALSNRGFAHGSQGRVDEAIADYTRAIELPGAHAEQVARALSNRGAAHGRQGRVEQEIADYTRVIELPGAPTGMVAKALFNRGVLHGRQGRINDAVADCTRAIELPGAPAEQVAKALFGRGVAHGLQGRDDEAVADYTRAIELPGAPAAQVATALVNRGAAHGRQGRVEQEIADYTRAIELPGAPAEQVATAHYNRGVIHRQQGRLDEAITDYTRAIELPDAPVEMVARALYNRGVVRGRQGRDDEAVADYTRAIELPGAPAELVTRSHFLRGRILCTNGEKANGCSDLRRAAELARENGLSDLLGNVNRALLAAGCDD